MRNHPLEGDDVITGFYNFLAKRNPKTMKPCKDILVPDTVVFEHNFPRGWYTTDVKAREVTRKQGKELDASTIEHGFVDGVPDSCPVVATYLCTVENDAHQSMETSSHDEAASRTQTMVEVFNKSTIGAFLSRKTKREGILQKFILPKGYYNSVIKAVWSPRICMVHRRTNKYHVDDKKRAECDPFSNIVTYEGPTFLSEESSVSSNIADAVKRACGNIVQHFYYTEHKFITRMVLYFKTDKNDMLWFLWCGSLRVSDRTASEDVPLNLVTNFSEPADRDNFDEDQLLWQADQAYLNTTNDEMFYETYMKHVPHANSVSNNNSGDSVAAQLVPSEQNDTPSSKDSGEDRTAFDWSTAPAEVQSEHSRLTHEREEVLTAVEDVLYLMRAQRTNPSRQPFVAELTPPVVEALSLAKLDELMATVYMQRIDDSDTEGTHTSIVRYTYHGSSSSPLPKMHDDAKTWIDEYYNAKLDELRDVHVS